MAKKNVVKQKHEPIRTCIGTGEKLPKKQLIRLVRIPNGDVIIDIHGKTSGRGANIKPSLEAFDLAVKKNAINRALKLEKPIGKEELNQLRDNFKKAVEEKDFRPTNRPVTIKVKKEEIK